MKWKRWVLSVLLTMMIPTIAYAGEINAEEQSVLAVACGTFEYKGVIYQATSEYMAEARAKLMQDDVDLTAEQAQEAITSIYANVQTGIEEGYIVPVSVSGNGEVTENEGTSQSKDASENKDTLENEGTGSESGEKAEIAEQTGSGDSKNTTTNDTYSNNETMRAEEAEEEKTPEEIRWEAIELPKMTRQLTDIIAENHIELEESSESETIIIKDIGYTISGIWIVPIIFLTGIGICAMCIMKYHLLAHNNES